MIGTSKSALLTEMQVAVIAALLVSVASIAMRNGTILAVQLAPFALLANALFVFRKKFSREFAPYLALFGALFAVSIAMPFAVSTMTASFGPLELANYLIYAVIVIFIAFILLKTFATRRLISGEVLLADRLTAAVAVDYDLFSGVKAGKYVVQNRGAKKGDRVMLTLAGGVLKTAQPAKIAEILK